MLCSGCGRGSWLRAQRKTVPFEFGFGLVEVLIQASRRVEKAARNELMFPVVRWHGPPCVKYSITHKVKMKCMGNNAKQKSVLVQVAFWSIVACFCVFALSARAQVCHG